MAEPQEMLPLRQFLGSCSTLRALTSQALPGCRQSEACYTSQRHPHFHPTPPALPFSGLQTETCRGLGFQQAPPLADTMPLTLTNRWLG